VEQWSKLRRYTLQRYTLQGGASLNLQMIFAPLTATRHMVEHPTEKATCSTLKMAFRQHGTSFPT
jgi:hypothetical protein